jgi:hypothetical protein
MIKHYLSIASRFASGYHTHQTVVQYEITDIQYMTQQMYDFGFSRRFVLVRVWYLSSSEAYTNNWGLFGKEKYLTFDWWKHFLKILRRSEVTINLIRRLKKNGKVVHLLGWPLPICVQTFPCVNESFWLAKYFHPFKLRYNFLPFANLYAL